MSFFYTIIVGGDIENEGCRFTQCTNSINGDTVHIIHMDNYNAKKENMKKICDFYEKLAQQEAFKLACLVSCPKDNAKDVFELIKNNKLVTIENDMYTLKKHPELNIIETYTSNKRIPNNCKQPQNGGSQKKKVRVLGRERVVTKVGRKQMVVYKGQQISLTEARDLERKIKSAKASR